MRTPSPRSVVRRTAARRTAARRAADLAALALAVWPTIAAPREPALASRRPLVADVADRAAATPPAVLTFELYADRLALATEGPTVPAVKLLDAGGTPIADAALSDATGRGGARQRHWSASFRVNNEPIAHLEPGLTISVTVGAASMQLIVPALDIRVDAARHAVIGLAPWRGPVELAFADALPFSRALPERPTMVMPLAGGSYRFDLDPATDIGTGVVATVTVTHPDGHRISASAAEPAVIVDANRATVFAAYGSRPALVFTDANGEVWRSASADWQGGSRYTILLAEVVGADVWRFEPRAGQNVRLELGGAMVADEPADALAWRFEPEVGQLEGRALPGARVFFGTSASRAWGAGVEHRAAADGSFAIHGLSDGNTPIHGYLWSWTGGRIATWTLVVPTVEIIDMFSNRLALSWAYTSDVDGTYTPRSGAPPIKRRLVRGLQPVSRFDIVEHKWFDDAGQPAAIAPGDRISLRGADGLSVTLAVPPLGLDLPAAGDRIDGTAVRGATVSAVVWPDAGDILSPNERPMDNTGVVGVSANVGADGRFTVQCPWPCANAFARVTITPPWAGVGTGRARYLLYALGRTWTGAAVSVGTLRGFASAGTAITATLLDVGGKGLDSRRTISSPPGVDRLPRWTIDWTDRFPDGIPPGTRFALDVGAGGRAVALGIPRVTIESDVVADTVRGTAPAGAAVEVWALPNEAVDAMRKATKAVGVVGEDGGWEVVFEGFNLRAEDDLVVNVLDGGSDGAGGVFYQYDIGHVAGPPEATPGPSPTVGPTARPSATGVPGAEATSRAIGRVFMPVALASLD